MRRRNTERSRFRAVFILVAAAAAGFLNPLHAAEQALAEVDVNDGESLAEAMRADRLEYLGVAVVYYSKHRDAADAGEKALAYLVIGESGAALLRKSGELTKKAISEQDPQKQRKLMADSVKCEEEGLLYVMEAAKKNSGRESARWWTVGAEHELVRGDTAATDEMIDKALKADGKYPDAYMVRGNLLFRLKKFRKSAENYDIARVFGKDDKSLPYTLFAAFAWEEAGEPAKAAERYGEVVEAEPDNFLWRTRLLPCLNSAGKTKQAEEVRKELLARYSLRSPEWQADNSWQCIDKFKYQDYPVRAYENFAATILVLYRTSQTDGKLPLFHYVFKVGGGRGEENREQMLVVLQSRVSEKAGGGREFFLERYAKSQRWPYGKFSDNLPLYGDVRKAVVEVLSGARQPVSPAAPDAGGVARDFRPLPDMNPETIRPDDYFRIIKKMENSGE